MPQDLKVKVAAEDELHIGPADRRGQLVGIPQPQRPLHLDFQRNRRVMEAQDRSTRRRVGQYLAQPVKLGTADLAVTLARHE